MKVVEKILSDNKAEIDRLEVPDVLEARLREALEHKQSRSKTRRSYRMKIAVALIAILLFGYQFDALAYYGKKLLGYDQMMSGTLQKLNALGKGQEIGKSMTLKNGITLTLDGIMLDDNQMLVFYTIKNPKGKLAAANSSPSLSIKGIWKNYFMQSGYGNMNESNTEMKNIYSFQPPAFYEKKLKLNIVYTGGGLVDSGQISFILDRNKAMGHTLNKNLNQAIEVDETKIHFDSITASPTKTVIKGTLQNTIELAKDQILGERFRPSRLNMKLFADGKEIMLQGSGMRTDGKGIRFNQDFDALPPGLKQLQLQLISFGADHDVKQQVPIRKDMAGQTINVLGQKLEISKVYESKGDTYITLTSEESVLLSRVYLMADSNKFELKETLSDAYDKKVEDNKAEARILHRRTLHFEGTGSQLMLDIQRMAYEKIYNQTIEIPVN